MVFASFSTFPIIGCGGGEEAEVSSLRIAFNSVRDGNDEIYLMNADGSGDTRVTNHPAPDLIPEWSPDGSKIVFESDRDGNTELYVMNTDGSGQTNITNNPAPDRWPRWSPDSTLP